MRTFFSTVALLMIDITVFPQSAIEIVRKADEKMRGNTAVMELTIKTIRPKWSRVMEVKAWTKGNDYAMILIQSPAKEKGIVFLRRKKEVWNWVPALERTIKMPPSMMTQSWMGTDFTNDDLVKESSIISDYVHTIVGDTLVQNRPCTVIQLIPKAEAGVVWSKLLMYVDKEDFLELHTRFFDEDGKLVTIMNAYDIKILGGRLIPSRFEMIPMDKPGQKTEMIYRSVQYNKAIDDVFFTSDKMRSIQ